MLSGLLPLTRLYKLQCRVSAARIGSVLLVSPLEQSMPLVDRARSFMPLPSYLHMLLQEIEMHKTRFEQESTDSKVLRYATLA